MSSRRLIELMSPSRNFRFESEDRTLENGYSGLDSLSGSNLNSVEASVFSIRSARGLSVLSINLKV